jgi:hypothetical protein
MKRPLPALAACCALLIQLVSCSSTMPTAEQLDAYYQSAEEQAQRKIAFLNTDLAQGHINQEQYDFEVERIKADIPRKANEIAWTRHDLSESQRRALGIPTGDTRPEPPRPSTGGGGESFYRQSGNYGGGYGGTTPGRASSPTGNARFGGL